MKFHRQFYLGVTLSGECSTTGRMLGVIMASITLNKIQRGANGVFYNLAGHGMDWQRSLMFREGH